MAVVEFQLEVNAPIKRVFDLSRSIEVHLASTGKTQERAVAGVTSGLIGMNEEVEWEAIHFGVRQRLRSRITRFQEPTHFRDSMVAGAFRRFDHDHFFDEAGGGTLMRERFDYNAPLSFLGSLAERLFLSSYMRRFLWERARVVKAIAESDDWRRYLPPEQSQQVETKDA